MLAHDDLAEQRQVRVAVYPVGDIDYCLAQECFRHVRRRQSLIADAFELLLNPLGQPRQDPGEHFLVQVFLRLKVVRNKR